MKKIGLIAVSAVTLCWAMYEVSSDNTSTTPRNESNQKVVSKSSSSTAKNEKLAPQMLLTQTNSLNSTPVCKYNFDATQEDFDLWNSEYPDFPIKNIPIDNWSKIWF